MPPCGFLGAAGWCGASRFPGHIHNAPVLRPRSQIGRERRGSASLPFCGSVSVVPFDTSWFVVLAVHDLVAHMGSALAIVCNMRPAQEDKLTKKRQPIRLMKKDDEDPDPVFALVCDAMCCVGVGRALQFVS